MQGEWWSYGDGGGAKRNWHAKLQSDHQQYPNADTPLIYTQDGLPVAQPCRSTESK